MIVSAISLATALSAPFLEAESQPYVVVDASVDTRPGDAAVQLRDSIRERVEWLAFQEATGEAGLPILAAGLVAELYDYVDYEPLWADRAQVDALWQLNEMAYAEGLDTDDYPLDLLLEFLPPAGLPADTVDRTRVDLLATEIFLRIGYQLRFGKVNPARLFAEWNFDRPLVEGEARAELLVGLIRAESMVDEVARITNRGQIFGRLIELLAELRQTDAQGGWPAVASGATLRPGAEEPRVAALHTRLGVRPADAGENHFGPTLEQAVTEFQRHHGLDADGIVGPATITALNVPVGVRIRQVRASLERARWVFEDYRALDGPVVIVNIAAAQARLLDGGKALWIGRAQVGRPYRQTPVFRGDMTYLEFNPTWTVPPTILKKDILPRLRNEGVGYLVEKNMDLLDLDGAVVDPSTIDWPNLGRAGFPYMLRQRPGPWNALGMVKFMFPNSYFIFLHDTPSRDLFDRSARAFSSGCIRVEDPFELARILLGDPERWSQQKIHAVLESGQRTVAHLPSAVPVYLLYWTAMVDADGQAYFYSDIYGRDEVIFAAIDADPTLDIAKETFATMGE